MIKSQRRNADNWSMTPRRLSARAIAGLTAVAVLSIAAPAVALPSNTTRVAGVNRYATAAELVAGRWSEGVNAVYLVNGSSFADALSAAPAAGSAEGPVLLTAQDALPPETAAALEELRPATVVVVGGPAAVSEAVFEAVREFTPGTVTRVAGADRYATSAALSRAAFPDLPDALRTVFVASGESFADALGGSAAASGDPSTPLLLTARDVLPTATASELERLDPDEIVIVGGTGAVGAGVEQALRAIAPVTRHAGVDRYETAAIIAEETFRSVPEVLVATGTGFADGLVAGALGAPLLLVPRGSVPERVLDALEEIVPAKVTVLGGTAVVTDEQATVIGEKVLALRDTDEPPDTQTPPEG